MLFIVGTGHHYQLGAGVRFGQNHCTEADQTAFAQMLRDVALSVAAQALAEELNQQAIAEVGKATSVIRAWDGHDVVDLAVGRLALHYAAGKKISKKELRELKLEREEFHGEWNYRIRNS